MKAIGKTLAAAGLMAVVAASYMQFVMAPEANEAAELSWAKGYANALSSGLGQGVVRAERIRDKGYASAEKIEDRAFMIAAIGGVLIVVGGAMLLAAPSEREHEDHV